MLKKGEKSLHFQWTYGALRFVGAANGANPIPVVIPCHPVIGKNGTLTGYRGGLDLKADLLRITITFPDCSKRSLPSLKSVAFMIGPL
ncbi:MGMT family protein [Paenactinomyces guangxiensis]|nr:MGMT family protein [Paenactinomyces guangxiensis]